MRSQRAGLARLGVLLVVVLAFAACDGTAIPMLPADPVPDSSVGLGPAVARAVCEKIDQCCSPVDRMRVIGAGEDRPSCEVTFGSFYGRQYGPIEDAIAEERTSFAPDKLAECLIAYRGAGCGAPGFTTAAACAAAVVGTRPLGAACANSYECASRYCNGPRTGERVCTARRPNGQACSRGGECVSFFCSTGFLGGGTCSSEPLAGDSCGGDGFWLSL